MDRISNETIFLAKNKIETYDDLMNFKNSNEKELSNLKNQRENLWRKYRRAKTNNVQSEIYVEINNIFEKIKMLNNYRKYCDGIETRSKTIEANINEFNSNNLYKTKEKIIHIWII